MCKYLGITKGQVEIQTFSDGEIWAKYKENIRGRDVYIVQSTMPPAENLLELLIMIDAAKRSSALRVTAVIPYFGYARQDRKDQPRVSISAKLIANLIAQAGADRVITMDLHAAQIQGFFDIPLDHIYASPVYTSFLKDKFENLAVVSPDIGGIKMARSYANKIGGRLVVIDKRRPEPNKAEVLNILGEIEGHNVLVIDDLIDTGGTFVNAVEALIERGAKNVYGAVTHGLLSGGAIESIEKSDITKLFITDTIPLKHEISKIEIRTATHLFAEAVIRSFNNESISSLFDVDKS
jgi:ribose-phosphate pyrophosphokinase